MLAKENCVCWYEYVLWKEDGLRALDFEVSQGSKSCSKGTWLRQFENKFIWAWLRKGYIFCYKDEMLESIKLNRERQFEVSFMWVEKRLCVLL